MRPIIFLTTQINCLTHQINDTSGIKINSFDSPPTNSHPLFRLGLQSLNHEVGISNEFILLKSPGQTIFAGHAEAEQMP